MMTIGMEDFLAGTGPQAAAVLADLDGCLISGSEVLPHVPALFDRASDRIWIVSNNSSDTATTLALRLRGLGLNVAENRILLAGEQTLRALASDRPGARVALFASAPLRALAADLGLRVDYGQRAEIAILGRDPAFGMEDLTCLMRLAHRGVPLHLTNADPTHPAADGTPVPETGALLAALRAGVPSVAPISLGKPAPDLIQLALSRAGVAERDAVFIGDTDSTDGAAARTAGVRFYLLRRPGVAQPEVLQC